MAQPETVLRAVKKAAEERTSESGQRNAVQATLAQYGYFKLPQLQTFSEGRATVRAYVWLDVGGKDLLLITGPSFTPEVRFARDDEYHDADEYGVFVPATHGGMKEDHRAALERARDRHRGEGKIVGRAEPKRTRKPPPKKPSRPKVRSGMEFRTEGPDFRPRTPEGRFVPAMQKPGYHPRDRPTPQGGQWATPRQEWTAQRSREMKQEAKDIEKQFDRLAIDVSVNIQNVQLAEPLDLNIEEALDKLAKWAQSEQIISYGPQGKKSLWSRYSNLASEYRQAVEDRASWQNQYAALREEVLEWGRSLQNAIRRDDYSDPDWAAHLKQRASEAETQVKNWKGASPHVTDDDLRELRDAYRQVIKWTNTYLTRAGYDAERTHSAEIMYQLPGEKGVIPFPARAHQKPHTGDAWDIAEGFGREPRPSAPEMTPDEQVKEVREILKPIAKRYGFKVSVRKGRGSVKGSVMVRAEPAEPEAAIAVMLAMMENEYEDVIGGATLAQMMPQFEEHGRTLINLHVNKLGPGETRQRKAQQDYLEKRRVSKPAGWTEPLQRGTAIKRMGVQEARSLASPGPFRAPHFSVNVRGLLQELDAAKGGVLFLDELDLFSPAAIDQLGAKFATGYTDTVIGWQASPGASMTGPLVENLKALGAKAPAAKKARKPAKQTAVTSEELAAAINRVSETGDEGPAYDLAARASEKVRMTVAKKLWGAPRRGQSAADIIDELIGGNYNEWQDSGGGYEEEEEVAAPAPAPAAATDDAAMMAQLAALLDKVLAD